MSLLAALQSMPAYVPEACIIRDTIERATAECPSLRWARGVSFKRTHGGSYRMGTAWPTEHRIAINMQGCTTDTDIVETVLHELCHIALWQEGKPHKDSAWEFGERCEKVFAEWNALAGTIHADIVRGGAYMGYHGQKNKAIIAARRKMREATA